MQRNLWFGAAAWLLSTACANTHLAEHWKAPDYSGGRLKKVLVVGMTADPTLRNIFEGQMTKLLSEHGTPAARASDVLPSGGKLTQDALEKAVQDGGFDSVLVNRPAVVKDRENYVPGGLNPFYGGFTEYYMRFFPYAYDPTFFTTTSTYKVISNLYSVDQNKLIWSATSESFDPNSRQSAAHAAVKAVARRLEKDGLVSPEITARAPAP